MRSIVKFQSNHIEFEIFSNKSILLDKIFINLIKNNNDIMFDNSNQKLFNIMRQDPTCYLYYHLNNDLFIGVSAIFFTKI
jgi:hypothetical protein